MKHLRHGWASTASLAVVLALLGACGSGSNENRGGNAAGSCVAPYLNDQPPDGSYRSATSSVRAGRTLTVYGHWYAATCGDTGGQDPVKALAPVHLALTLPGDETDQLGVFTPGGRDLGLAAVVRIPPDTPAGIATIRDDRTPSSARYWFRISD